MNSDLLIWVVLVIGVMGFGVAFWVLYRRVKTLEGKYSKIFGQNGAEDIDQMVEIFSDKLSKQERDVEKLFTHLKKSDTLISQSVETVQLLKFNPFDDVGGKNSFVVAILDREKNGVMLTGVALRNETKIFAKQVKRGLCEGHLTPYEKEILGKYK
jgi:hypothetical protein